MKELKMSNAWNSQEECIQEFFALDIANSINCKFIKVVEYETKRELNRFGSKHFLNRNEQILAYQPFVRWLDCKYGTQFWSDKYMY